MLRRGLLHASSKSRERPFVQIDCASLPKDLIEAELFGHEKGAYTGAGVARTGLIEAAEDGTLFLDEIGELPLGVTSKITQRDRAAQNAAHRRDERIQCRCAICRRH